MPPRTTPMIAFTVFACVACVAERNTLPDEEGDDETD